MNSQLSIFPLDKSENKLYKYINMSNLQESSEIKPPYLSIAKMQDLFELLTTRTFSSITFDDIAMRGFSRTDAFVAIQTLRFLGLIESDGKTVEDIRQLSMKGEAREKKLQDIVKTAYSKIFDTVADIELLNRDALYNEFLAQYRLSPRLANSAVPVFIWLCSEANIKLSNEIELKIRPIQQKKQTKNSQKLPSEKPMQKKDKEFADTDFDYHVFNISGIILKIPKTRKTDDVIVSGGLSEIRTKIIAFANQVELKEKSNQEDN